MKLIILAIICITFLNKETLTMQQTAPNPPSRQASGEYESAPDSQPTVPAAFIALGRNQSTTPTKQFPGACYRATQTTPTRQTGDGHITPETPVFPCRGGSCRSF